jgi:hypothetical protein
MNYDQRNRIFLNIGSIDGKISIAGTSSPLTTSDPNVSNPKSELSIDDSILQSGSSNTKVVKILKQNEPLVHMSNNQTIIF